MVGVAAAELGEEIGVGSIRNELLAVVRGADRGAAVDVTGADRLIWIVAFALLPFATGIGT